MENQTMWSSTEESNSRTGTGLVVRVNRAEKSRHNGHVYSASPSAKQLQRSSADVIDNPSPNHGARHRSERIGKRVHSLLVEAGNSGIEKERGHPVGDRPVTRKLRSKQIHDTQTESVAIAARVEKGFEIPPSFVASVLADLGDDFLHLQLDQGRVHVIVTRVEVGENFACLFWTAFGVEPSR